MYVPGRIRAFSISSVWAIASNSVFVSWMVFGAGTAFCLHHLQCPPHLREISHFLSLLSKHKKQMKKGKIHSYAKNKVTLTRWLEPLNPRASIDWKLRLHPSPARTDLDISQSDVTFSRKPNRADLPERGAPPSPLAHPPLPPLSPVSWPSLSPSLLSSGLSSSSSPRLSHIIFIFNMSKRENRYSVTLN